MAYFSGDESVRYGDTDDDEETATLDIEQTKRELRRMSLDLNAIGTRRYGVNDVEISPRDVKPKSILKNTRGLIESDDDTIIEEEVDDLDVTEIEEEDEEILEEVIEEVVDASEVIEEIADDYEDEELQPDTIIEGDEDEEIEEEEEDEATEEEVREAIIYILKQEKPIDNGYLTSDQATRMMALPFKDMKEIMKHFELCDNAGEPIQWSVIADIVTPEDHGDEEEDLDDEEDCNEFCPVHGYSYCTECEVGLEPSTSSDDESEGDEVGSLGSGFDLQVPAKDKVDEGHISDISKLDLTDFDDVSD